MNTITIFCTHIYFVKAVGKFIDIKGDLTGTVLAMSFSVVILALCLVFSIFFAPLLNRYILRK